MQAFIAGGAVLSFLLLFGALFRRDALGAVQVWLGSRTFNHCFLVVPLSLYLIWDRRKRLHELHARPDLRAAVGMFVLSGAWLAGSLLGVLEIEQVVVLTMIQFALVGALGTTFYRKLAAPFLFLYFLVPSGSMLIPFLQIFTARFAVTGLHVLGIPVFSNGAVIDIPAGTFVVEEACAGLRFLVAAVAFGVFFAVITYRSWWRRAAFVVLSFIVPVIANGFRALGLIAAAQWIGNPAAALADHILYGWIFFSLILVLLIFAGQKFSDAHAEEDEGVVASGRSEDESTAMPKMAVTTIVLLLAASAAPLGAVFLLSPRQLAVSDFAPKVAPPWHNVASATDWQPVIIGATRSFAESFVNGPVQVDRFIALYGMNGAHSNLLRSDNRDADERSWNFNSSGSAKLSVGGRSIPVDVTTWTRGSEHRTVWSFYVVNGEPASGIWNVKRDQLLAYLSGDFCVPAYIAVSIRQPTENASRAAAGFLRASAPLKPYLCRSTDRLKRK